MGWIQDLLTEVPLSAVMRERLQLAEQKYDEAVAEAERLRERVAELEAENTQLRKQMPSEPAGELGETTKAVAVYLFRHEGSDRDVGIMAQRLGIEQGVAKYHLERLKDRDMAACTGGNYVHGHVYWSLTSEGRRFVVENDLID